MNKPPPRPLLTLGRSPSKPVPTPEQKAARVAEEQRAARIARATAVRALRADLMETYPAAFPGPPAAPVPLAIGIHRALLEAVRGKHSVSTVKVFLSRWTHAAPYLAALVAGEPRRNLDGAPVGEPTEKDREAARQTLDARKS